VRDLQADGTSRRKGNVRASSRRDGQHAGGTRFSSMSAPGRAQIDSERCVREIDAPLGTPGTRSAGFLHRPQECVPSYCQFQSRYESREACDRPESGGAFQISLIYLPRCEQARQRIEAESPFTPFARVLVKRGRCQSCDRPLHQPKTMGRGISPRILEEAASRSRAKGPRN